MRLFSISVKEGERGQLSGELFRARGREHHTCCGIGRRRSGLLRPAASGNQKAPPSEETPRILGPTSSCAVGVAAIPAPTGGLARPPGIPDSPRGRLGHWRPSPPRRSRKARQKNGNDATRRPFRALTLRGHGAALRLTRSHICTPMTARIRMVLLRMVLLSTAQTPRPHPPPHTPCPPPTKPPYK